MDPSIVLALSRGMERLAIVGLSGLSLVLGWDLFRRGVLNAQNADFKAHGWSIRLQRVGPGIFFALFATVAFVAAVTHPLEITTGRKTDVSSKINGSEVSRTTTENQRISEAENVNASSDRDLVIAINTVHLVLLPAASGSMDAAHTAAINKADEALNLYKKSLIFQRFGEMSTQFYSIKDRVPMDPSILGKQSTELQNKYPEIEAWDKDTFLKRP